MAKRTTRNMIRHNARQTFEYMTKAVDSMALMASHADGRSPHIDSDLPPIMAAQKIVQDTFEKLYEKL